MNDTKAIVQTSPTFIKTSSQRNRSSKRWLYCFVLLCFGIPSLAEAGGWRPSQVTNRDALKERKFALLIGIDRFQNKRWPVLKYTQNDIKRMGTALKDLAGFQVTYLSKKRDTKRTSIQKALQQFGKRVKSSLDTVVIYISTHGVVASSTKSVQQQRYIITSDTQENIPRTALSVQAIKSIIKKYRSKRIVLILATCYTGLPDSKSVMLPGAKQAPGSQRASRRFQQNPAMQILSAASYAQPAFESKRLRSDVYTHFFIDCLQDARKKQQAVTAIQAHVCASVKTTSYVRKHRGAIQVPTAYSELGYNRDIFLIGKSKPVKLGSLYLRGMFQKSGQLLIRPMMGQKGQGTGAISSMRLVASRHETVSLLPGRYRLARLDHNQQESAHWDVDIQAGKRTSLFTPTWGLGVDAGIFRSPIGGDLGLFGGYFGLRNKFFAAKLGILGTSIAFENSPGPNNTPLFFDLRLEGGYDFRRGAFSLFTGGYASFGLLVQDIQATPIPGFVFGYGITTTGAFYLRENMGITLSGDIGFSLLNQANAVKQLLGWGIRLGFVYLL